MLFDKHDKPGLSGLDEESDWAAVEAFEDYIYSVSEKDSDCSDDEFDNRIAMVRDAYADYYALYES